MGKVIMVSDDVYESLRRIKRPGESFSDVIRRLLRQKPRLMEVAGSKTVSLREWKEVEEVFREQVELDDIRRKYLLNLIRK